MSDHDLVDFALWLVAQRTVEVSPVTVADPPPTRRRQRPPGDRSVEISPVTLRG